MISGGIKIFNRSQCLAIDDNTVAASSGDAGSIYCIDKNPISYWRSVGSTDLITETITLTFASATIDRVILLDHNFKDFNIKYLSGGTYTHFSSVTGISGSMANITETAFAYDTAYYEVASVTTTSIQITVLKTQTANEEKYLNQVIVTNELGTLSGYPQIKNTEFDRNLRKKEMLSGKVLVLKSEESFKVDLDFKDYPPSLSADIALMMSLYDREINFLVWLCGGRTGNYFKYQLRGYRLKDVISVQCTAPIKLLYTGNIYRNPVNFTIKLEEAVD